MSIFAKAIDPCLNSAFFSDCDANAQECDSKVENIVMIIFYIFYKNNLGKTPLFIYDND
jgi:hypothetical protein